MVIIVVTEKSAGYQYTVVVVIGIIGPAYGTVTAHGEGTAVMGLPTVVVIEYPVAGIPVG